MIDTMNDKQYWAAKWREQYGLQPREFRSLECDNEMTAQEVAKVALEFPSGAYERWWYDFSHQLLKDRRQLGFE